MRARRCEGSETRRPPRRCFLLTLNHQPTQQHQHQSIQQGTKHRNWDVVLPHTDGVLFCIKSLDPDKYASMTGLKQLGALRFAAEVRKGGKGRAFACALRGGCAVAGCRVGCWRASGARAKWERANAATITR